MNKYTPGPWRAISAQRTDNPHVWAILGPLDEVIAETARWLDTDPKEESKANAWLLAAAPKLYEALKDLYEECEAAQGPELRDDPNWLHVLHNAEDALGKAEGN